VLPGESVAFAARKSSAMLQKQRRGRRARVPRKKAVTKLIKSVLNRELETKYSADQVQLAGYVIQGGITPAADNHIMLPAVPFQTGAASSFVREGDSIKPIQARIAGHIWYDNLDTVVGNVVFVKLFFVVSKQIKDQSLLGNLPIGLLESGTADPVGWTASAQDLQAFYPVNKEQYTVMKTMTFKFVKNGGLPIGNQPGHDTNLNKDRYSFSYSWKPPTLKYATQAAVYPQNYAPIMFAVAYSPGYNYTTDASTVNQVKMNWQVSLSYKDA